MDAVLTMFNTVSDVEECGTTQTALQGLQGGMAYVPALESTANESDLLPSGPNREDCDTSLRMDPHWVNGPVDKNHNMAVPDTVGVSLTMNTSTGGCDKAGTGVAFQSEGNDPETNSFSAISTTFNTTFKYHNYLPDTQLVSSDSVLFEVRFREVVIASTNGFNKLLDHHVPRVSVPETSEILNIILHAIHRISCFQFRHSIDTLMAAVNLFPKYGLEPKKFVSPSSPLFKDIRYKMPLSPLKVYVVASRHDLADLAAAASSHLLSFKIATMSNEMAQLINPIYLKRLFDLQTTRIDTLKRALSIPPAHHPATPACDFIAQKSLTRAWAFCAAYLVCSANAGMTASRIESVFQALADRYISCDECKGCLKARLKSIILEWSELKRTI
ncbi:hypothetical protein ARMSODRAFT_994760 [Armillaria solidipes]|uniref:BTB domain-containing protein n=1 Tax=Armillaria solidipes TaxID=1076256 RepID=A0A2H3C355_9AGAR|nr:hypothetical protein ARMSODRAFT_994760 [Armillaria solidipes]